jgi:hypothetical protein
MEIVDTCHAMPCNAEVLQFLKENRAKIAGKSPGSATDKGQAKAATVVLETLNYLEKTPAVAVSELLKGSKLNTFFKATDPYKLTPSEILQILNHCPKVSS